MATVTEDIPFQVEKDRHGNVYLRYSGADFRGTVVSYTRPVGPENPTPGMYHDALGMAVLRTLAILDRVTRERDEYLEMLAEEPRDRRKKKNQPAPETKAV